MSPSEEMAKQRTDLASERTAWAEDRTLMANERTFAGWMRTGLASVGVGIAFNALFGKLDPQWLARSIATVFIILGIFIFLTAQQRACGVLKRLNSHCAQPIKIINLRIISAAMSIAAALLAFGIWSMDGPN